MMWEGRLSLSLHSAFCICLEKLNSAPRVIGGSTSERQRGVGSIVGGVPHECWGLPTLALVRTTEDVDGSQRLIGEGYFQLKSRCLPHTPTANPGEIRHSGPDEVILNLIVFALLAWCKIWSWLVQVALLSSPVAAGDESDDGSHGSHTNFAIQDAPLQPS